MCSSSETPNGTHMVKSSDGKRDYLVTVDCNRVTCTCVGFKSHKHCKHVTKIVGAKKCEWNQFIYGGKPVISGDKMFCPKCGQPAVPSKV